MDKRTDGTISGMYGIEGHYRVGENEPSERQINVYDVRCDDEALKRAKRDGLIQAVMVEVYPGGNRCMLREI